MEDRPWLSITIRRAQENIEIKYTKYKEIPKRI